MAEERVDEVPSFEQHPARVVMCRAWLAHVIWIAFACTPLVLLWLLGATKHGVGAGVVPVGFWLCVVTQLVALAAVVARHFLPDRREGNLRVVDGRISIDGRPLIALEEVAQAVALAGSNGTRVQLSRSTWSLRTAIDVELASSSDAQRFLEAIGRDTAQATASFIVARGGMVSARRAARTVYGAIAAFVLSEGGVIAARLMGHLGIATLLAAVWVAALAVIGYVSASVPRQIEVGADGILIKPAKKGRVFRPYREIRNLQLIGDDLEVTWISGQVERFGLRQRGRAFRGAEELAPATIFDRIAQAWRRHVQVAAEASEDLANVLTRGDQDASTWRKSLEAVLATVPTYRTAVVGPEKLWKVVLDPTQPETMRAGAAVALRVAVDEEGRQRLRVATKSSASTELRRALEAAAEDDDDALDTALNGVLRVKSGAGV